MNEEELQVSTVADPSLISEDISRPDSTNPGGGETGEANQWLKSSSMVATKHCMALVSTVLGFDIVELWSCCTTESGEMDTSSLRCTYVHASNSLIEQHPGLITGNYPEQKKKHKISPALVELAFKSKERQHWRVVNELTPDGKTLLHPSLWIPGKTEMAYMMRGSGTEEMDHLCVFIVAFSVDAIRLKPARLKFLDGIGTAIYVAAVYLDEDECKVEGADVELDVKEFNPKRPLLAEAQVEIESGQGLGQQGFSREGLLRAGSLGMGVWSDSPSRSRSGSHAPDRVSPSSAFDAAFGCAVGSSGSDSSSTHTWQIRVDPPAEGGGGSVQTLGGNSFNSVGSRMSLAIPEFGNRNRGGSNQSLPVDLCPDSIHLPPTWAPQYEFSFPVINIPVAHQNIPDSLVLDRDFRNVVHICDGSNSNIFRAIMRDDLTNQWVIIKMIMETAMHDSVAVHEFDTEHGLLCRINHPNIIKVLGAGRYPRRFIVLESLDGGSLSTILARNQLPESGAAKFANRFFRRPTFTYVMLLAKARDIAEALHYLHFICHRGATIIHRDLKPDNIGFTSTGQLKLFDFGLCTCVHKRLSGTDSYSLTGNTGSLRYMAPEVALRKPYTEKVDVYSFGVMIWQMAKDRIPFKGMNKAEFNDKVVMRNERPKIDKSWPTGFSNLLVSCWNPNPSLRPSFHQILKELNALSDAANHIKSSASLSTPVGPGKAKATGRPAAVTAGNARKNGIFSTLFSGASPSGRGSAGFPDLDAADAGTEQTI